MRIVMHSEKEKKLLLQLLDHLIKQNIDFFLDFEEPLSFQLEELFSELTSCDIEVDKKEEPAGISEL
ncbi:MAG: hypothetical protein ACXAAM_06115 [Candidatus Heimdallarchaeaceae archaeon]|jgi:hypothetical protein